MCQCVNGVCFSLPVLCLKHISLVLVRKLTAVSVVVCASICVCVAREYLRLARDDVSEGSDSHDRHKEPRYMPGLFTCDVTSRLSGDTDMLTFSYLFILI